MPIIRSAGLVCFSIIFVAAASAQSGRVQQTPTPPREDHTVRVSTEEIKLNVLAFTDNGEFFRDVTANDLVITENDILHQPASIRRLPARVLIVMDNGGELRSIKSVEKTRSVARALTEALAPGDLVAVMQYSDKAEVIGEWTSDKSQTLDAIKRAKFGRRSVFVDALRLAADYLQNGSLENKHLVLITDGIDSSGRSSAKFDAIQRLLATDISVHVLSYTSMEGADLEPRAKAISSKPAPQAPVPAAVPDEVQKQMPNGVYDPSRVRVGPTVNTDRSLIRKLKAHKADLELSQQQLEKLAESTNGEFILPEGVDEMIEKSAVVARMIDSTYVVTYAPKIPVVETRGIAERNIVVTSKRPGLFVEARRKLLLRSVKPH